ncbi:MAG: HD domain-containing protein [Alphaproteobacteria bacterium]|uniref:HD domain-containing protein n=1 Tax=Candidatus Nitrobium versatile TaxID=2884831 RepID=A0A953J7F0_9BACT|nr:HD domain-containing protein [Candidatus Nitrobium versatile]
MTESVAHDLIRTFFRRSFLMTAIVAVILSLLLPLLRYYSDIETYKEESLRLLENFSRKELPPDPYDILRTPEKHEDLLKRIAVFMEYGNLVEFKIWAPDTTVLYAHTDSSLTGLSFPSNKHLLETLSSGTMRAEIEEMTDAENRALQGHGKLLEMYLPVWRKGKIAGVLEVYRKTPQISFLGTHNIIIVLLSLSIPVLLYTLLYGQFKVAAGEILLYHVELNKMYKSLARSYFDAVRGLTKALELRDMGTEGHSERVVAYSVSIGRRLNLEEREMSRLVIGSYLHDIGKIGVSDTILLKPGPLTHEERKIMETHTVKGYELIKDIDFLSLGTEVVYGHHEKWDGSGYPRGLKGEGIHITARIFALVDVFDALMSRRPYKEPFPFGETRAIILEGRGVHFDPAVVDAFMEMSERELADIADEVRRTGIHHTVNNAIEKLLSITGDVR